MDIDISTLTRSKGEDPNDTTYTVDETTVGLFREGDRVRISDPTAFVGENPERIFTIRGFIVSDGEAVATFEEVSAVSGHADMSCLLRGLTLA